MATSSNTVETFDIEYQSVFTIDKNSAKTVTEQVQNISKKLVGKVAGQDQRFTSIVNKLKEMGGPDGAAGFTREMEKASDAVRKVAEQLRVVEAAKQGRGSAGAKLNRVYEEAVVALEKLEAKQRESVNNIKNEVILKEKSLKLEQQTIAARQRGTTVKPSKEFEQQRIIKEKISQIEAQIVLEQNEELRDAKRILQSEKEITSQKTQRIAKEKAIKKELAEIALLQRGTTVKPSKEFEDQLRIKKKVRRVEEQIVDEQNEELRDAKRILQIEKDITAQKTQRRDKVKQTSTNNFGDKLSSTIQYSAAGAAIYGVVGALRAGVGAIIEFDTASRTLSAVIQDLSLDKAIALEEQLIALGAAFGGTVPEINQAAILLGRAGIAQDKLIKSTEIVIKLSKITGDSLESTSGAMISYIEVFGKAGETVESLGDKLAFMANESRLSTQDIETFSNFALAAADAAGLTVDSVSALATEFSKAGVNASTIGTQIRSLTKVFLDNSKGVKGFFAEIGVVQANFQADLAAGGKQSNDAIVGLAKNLAGLTREEFNRVTASMDILQRNSLALLRQQSEGIAKDLEALTTGAHDGIAAANVVLGSYVTGWEKLKAAMTGVITTSTKVETPFIDDNGELQKTGDFFGYLAERVQLTSAALLGEDGAYDKVLTSIVSSNQLRDRAIILQIRQKEVTEANTEAQKDAAYENLVIAQASFTAYKNFTDKIKAEQKGSAENIKKDRDSRIVDSQQFIAAKKFELEAIIRNSKATGKTQYESRALVEDYSNVTKAIEEETKILNKNVAARDADIVKKKELIRVTQVTATETTRLAKGLSQLYAAGRIAQADAALPALLLADNLSVLNNQINNLNETKGVDNLFDDQIEGAITLEQKLQAIVEITLKNKTIREGTKGATQEEIAAANKQIEGGKAIISILEQQVAIKTTDRKVDTDRNNALTKLSAEERNVSAELIKQELSENNLLLRTKDKVSLAKQELEAANKLVNSAGEAIKYDRDGVPIKATLLAYDKAITDQKQKQANLTKTTIEKDATEAKLLAEAALGASKAKILLDTFSLVDSTEAKQRALINQRTILEDAYFAKVRQTNELQKSGEIDNALEVNRQLTAEYEAQDRILQRQAQSLDVNYQIMTQSADLLGGQLASALFDTTKGIDSWADAAENFKDGLIKIGIELLIIKPLIDSLKIGLGSFSLFGGVATQSATGNVFTGSGIDNKYATGGVVNTPTLFSQSDGSTNLMGEAGPEAILPLTRIGGDLGVKAAIQVSTEKGTGNTEINIINESGAPLDVGSMTRGKDDKGKEVINIVLQALNYNADFRKAIKNI